MSRSKPVKPDNIEFYRILSCNIRYFRESAGIRSADLASRIDITPSYLTTLESPARWDEHPSLEVLFDISKALNIEPSDLFRNLNAEASAGKARRAARAGGYALPPRGDLIADADPWMYDRRLGDLIDLFEDDGYAFMQCCMRHFDHRTDARFGP